MAAFDCGPGSLHDCGRCGAQFVEHSALRDLLERHDELDIPVARPPPVGWKANASVRYLPCPVCHAMMNRKNFGAASGVVVDLCSKHGTWFDAGELPRVLAFVESGGLARVRRRDAQESERLARERAAGATIHVLQEHDVLPFATESIVLDFLNDLFR
jgi:Zn-finger nucleic acid-binding protein